MLRLSAMRPTERLESGAQMYGYGAPSLPAGLRVYAFGDVHGRSDLLERLKRELNSIVNNDPSKKAIVVGLGDCIDRGPDSRGVIDLLIEGLVPGVEQVILRGNHEDLLLRFLDQPDSVGGLWFRLGGLDFLRSYGVDIRPYTGARPDIRMARAELARRLPSGHLSFVRSLPIWHVIGDFLFVHAGVRSGIPISHQAIEDLLWIRDGFSDRDEPFEKVVVHGHTPTDAPYLGRHRIGIDTAAYATNRLTCVVLEGSQRQVLTVESTQ